MANQIHDEEFMSDLFHELPKQLQDKIRPPQKLSPDELALNIARTLQVTPAKYRSRSALKQAIAAQSAASESPPITNRGGKSNDTNYTEGSWEAKQFLKFIPLGKKGKFETIAIPRPDRKKDVRHSFVDWVNFTFKVSDFHLKLSTGHPAISELDYIAALSYRLCDVFGFGVTDKRESGMNFYKSSYNLGINGWGMVCIGGQQDSCLVTVKGQGLMSAQAGWETRLYSLLKDIPGSKLTRIDLASDNFESAVTLDDYLSMYHAGLFVNRGRAPNVEQAGNWIKPNGKGRTLYIGGRQSGKLLRIYEKGLQLANGFHEHYSKWVRVELELKNDDRIIPFDALLKPGQYLAGAYPALANMHKVQSRIDTFKTTVKSTFERSIETTRHQFGKHIWTHVQVLGVEETIKRLTDGKQELPKNLNFDTFEQIDPVLYAHNDQIKLYSLEEIPL